MPQWHRTVAAATFLALATAVGAVAATQSLFRGFGAWGSPALPYTADVTFVRLRWDRGEPGAQVYGRGPNFWLHEFPRAEQHLMTLLSDFSTTDANANGSLILKLDDPSLFRYPDCADAGARLLADDRRGGGAAARPTS